VEEPPVSDTFSIAAGSAGKDPDPDQAEITNYKHQITNKFQYPKLSNKIKNQLFGNLNFGRRDLFDICVLLFEIFNC
jgi:hypothetical protein